MHGNPEHHKLRVVRLFADGEPTLIMWLMQWSPSEKRYVRIDTVEGHAPELFALDFDGDQLPEVAFRWGCGGHSRGFRLYRLRGGHLDMIPGTDIGSDWPEIEWADLDGDGMLEIYSKDRNWEDFEAGPVETRHVFADGGYRPSPVDRHDKES